MKSLRTLKKYIGHTFEDWGGVTSDDYKTFQTQYLKYIKDVCDAHGWSLIGRNRNHYEFSAVIQRTDGVYVYVSISDVRYFKNGWYKDILVRTMKHATDWKGNTNNSCTLDELENMIATVK